MRRQLGEEFVSIENEINFLRGKAVALKNEHPETRTPVCNKIFYNRKEIEHENGWESEKSLEKQTSIDRKNFKSIFSCRLLRLLHFLHMPNDFKIGIDNVNWTLSSRSLSVSVYGELCVCLSLSFSVDVDGVECV